MRRARADIALGLAALILLAGCTGSEPAAAPAGPSVRQQQLTVDGLPRTYRLFAPATLDRRAPVPLVLVLAGVGNTGEQMVGVTQFDRLAEKENIVVAYPEGVDRTWNGGYCCPNGATSQPDDVAFIDAVLDDVEAVEQIDPTRVFAVGFSGGAIMAHRLGCDLAARIAGVAAVSGSMVLDDCRPSEPVSVIAINGTVDELVPYEGGPTAGGATQPSPPAPEVVRRWAELNGCPPESTTVPEGVVVTMTWTGCSQDTAVRLITIEGGGHTWFAPGFGPVNGAVDATQAVWDFLSAGGPHRS
ncbi:MAG: PHB depolymerase family esterase [Mycobacteriales bacterium]